ncbi:MAG: pitrilysin family protein [Candidatus Paceibacterota bacterium]
MIKHKDFNFIKTVQDISEYSLKTNRLTVLYKHIPDTGVITSNIVYLAGARDELIGETGVAHMLEHMVFKPTKYDKERGLKDSGAMNFERNTGSVLNANTWKDRTCYYFSYRKENFSRVLQIEAERMQDVLLIDEEFKPERTNVLSEYDMYNGEPEFALSVAMVGTAYHSHPYGHETIGFREDIERYTTEKLQRFYKRFYSPNNATLIVVGDIDEKSVLDKVADLFKNIAPDPTVEDRPVTVEPKQEGVRRVEVVRAGNTNILAIGVKHGGFPTKNWFETMLTFKMLAGGADSLFGKHLVDTGLASAVSFMQEPTKDENLGIIYITLAGKTKSEKIEEKVLQLIKNIDQKWLKKRLKTTVAKAISSELYGRDSSLDIAGEMTEYIASGDWSTYFKTKELLSKITVKDIEKNIQELFTETKMTIGNYKSFKQ